MLTFQSTAEKDYFSNYMQSSFPMKMGRHLHIIVGIVAFSAVFPNFRKGALIGLGIGSALEITNKVIDFATKTQKVPAKTPAPVPPTVPSVSETPGQSKAFAHKGEAPKHEEVGTKELVKWYSSLGNYKPVAITRAILAPRLDNTEYLEKCEMVKDLVWNSSDRLLLNQIVDAVLYHQVIQYGFKEAIKAAFVSSTGLNIEKISLISTIAGIAISTLVKTCQVYKDEPKQTKRLLVTKAVTALANAIIFEKLGLLGSLGSHLAFNFVRYSVLVSSYSNERTYKLISEESNPSV